MSRRRPRAATGRRLPRRTPELDRWCLARLTECIDEVRAALDVYDATAATRSIELFVEDLSKWYVRRSRRRFWKAADVSDADKRSAYDTLYTALETLARLIAPFMPFLAERLHRNLSGHDTGAAAAGVPDSVHLTDYPEAEAGWRDPALVEEMARLRRLVEDGLGTVRSPGSGSASRCARPPSTDGRSPPSWRRSSPTSSTSSLSPTRLTATTSTRA